MDYQALVDSRTEIEIQRQALRAEADKLLAKENFTPEDEAKVTSIESQLERQKKRLALLDAQITEALKSPVVSDPSQPPKQAKYPYEVHIENPHPFPTLGHQLQAIARYAQNGLNDDPRLREALMNATRYEADAQGAGIAIDSDGGFLVMKDFSREIMKRIYDTGQVISRVRQFPITTNSNGINIPGIDETSRADGSRWGGVRGYWVEEGEAPTATKPTYYMVKLELKKVGALGYATEEWLQDAGLLSTIMTEAFAEELQFKLEDAIINGDGAGKPYGILNAAATVSVAKETNQTATTINHTNLTKMWARLWARSRANAVWFVNQDVDPQLDDLAKAIGTGGTEPRYVSQDENGVTRIKGRPVVPVEYCATLGTVGDIILADMSQYALVTKGGIRQDTSMHVRFTTDEQTFRAMYRVDGALLWKSALVPFKGSNNLSPVITLATRA